MADPKALSAAITEQTQRLNDLRLSKVQDQAVIDEAKKKLSELKKTLGELNRGAAGPKEDVKKRERLLLKTAKVSLVVLIRNPDLTEKKYAGYSGFWTFGNGPSRAH